MVNSGSSANLLAVFASCNPLRKNRFKPGDEVLIPVLCWSTSLWPLVQCGLKPVFVDVDKDTLNVNPELLIKKINNKTKIILRISGLPKLNFIRYIFWKLFSKKIYSVTCPTKATYEYLKTVNIFDKKQLFILRDPVIQLNEFLKKKNDKIDD